MSKALNSVTPLINQEIEFIPVLNIECIKPNLKCVFYDNDQSTIIIEKTPSTLSHNAHVDKYYYFRLFVQNLLLHMQRVSTEEQVGNSFIKPLPCITCMSLS